MSQEKPSLECNHAATLINCRFIASRTVRKHTHVAEYTMKKNEPATHISMPTKMSLTTTMGTTIYNPMRCESDGSGHGHVGAQSGSPQAPHQSNLSCFPVATPAASAQGKARGEGLLMRRLTLWQLLCWGCMTQGRGSTSTLRTT